MMRFWPLLGLSALFAVLAFACKGDGGGTSNGETPASSPAVAPTPKNYSERLGHATVGLTLDTYSHVLPDLQRDAAEVMDGVLASALRRSATGAT